MGLLGPLEGKEPEIQYPCRWTYKVIGEDEFELRAAVQQVAGHLRHSVSLSNSSKTGKYCSLRLEVLVSNEEQRRNLGESLHGHINVRLVL